MTAAALGGLAALAIRRFRSRALGQGDLYLYGLCGLIVGLEGFLAWAVLNAGFALPIAAWSARRRSRQTISISRTTFPAALAACPAAAAAYLLAGWPSG